MPGTIKVVDLLAAARGILLDEGAVKRWSDEKLLGWYNEAQRALIVRRPDAYPENAALTCVAGTKQALPAEAYRLLDVERNTNGPAITIIDRDVLDTNDRSWHTATPIDVAEHYTYDDRNPKVFFLYPAINAGQEVDIVYSRPAAVVEISDFETDDTLIDVDDPFANALQEYILHRAWAMDAEHAGNQQRSAAHFQQFRVAIGEITQADTAASPKNG